MKPSNRPILVTGAHRSGSTFAGKILSLPLNIAYIHEPFNKDHGVLGIDEWFPYVKTNGKYEQKYVALTNNIVNFNAKYKNPSQFSSLFNNGVINKTANLLSGGKYEIQRRFSKINPMVSRVLIKDPMACFASEWMKHKFNMDVVILVRHPAAFVASILRLNWNFDLDILKSRSKLYDDHLKTILNKNVDYSSFLQIEQAAILWNCIYKVLFTYAKRNKDMIVLTHEQLSKNPLRQFGALYSKLDLRFGDRVKQKIINVTSASDQTYLKQNQTHSIKRNSQKNIKNWKKRLSKKQILLIKNITWPLATQYYSDDDW